MGCWRQIVKIKIQQQFQRFCFERADGKMSKRTKGWNSELQFVTANKFQCKRINKFLQGRIFYSKFHKKNLWPCVAKPFETQQHDTGWPTKHAVSTRAVRKLTACVMHERVSAVFRGTSFCVLTKQQTCKRTPPKSHKLFTIQLAKIWQSREGRFLSTGRMQLYDSVIVRNSKHA